jgi:hypothetical protein
MPKQAGVAILISDKADFGRGQEWIEMPQARAAEE